MTSYPPLAPTSEQSRRIRDADEALARTPQDPDAIVDAALAREDVWRYQESIDLYTQGEALAPSDYRFPLGRAHRLIRLRKFEHALDDLDRALELDPYGFNTAYLRGFTRYVTGDFAAAAREYDRVFRLSRSPEALALARSGEMPGDPRHCMLIEEDPATRIAVTTWAFRALSRAGRASEAEALLLAGVSEVTPVAPDSDRYPQTIIRPDSNEHYHRTLLLYRGARQEEDVLTEDLGGQWPTVAYGVAVWHLLEGRLERAKALLRDVVSTPQWARLGHVAAEADLSRL